MQDDQSPPETRHDADTRLLEDALRERTRRMAAALDAARASRLAAESAEARAVRADEERDKALRDLQRFRGRGVVRAGRVIRGVLRAGIGGVRRAVVRSGRTASPGERPLRATRASERDLVRRLLASQPGGAPTDGPRVSIVVLNRDGLGHLRRLWPALGATRYRAVDVTLVDNASTDGSAAWVHEAALPFPVRIVENAQNESFSAANNAAARSAAGELVLFLNNDILPVDPDWLGYLVATIRETGAVGVGARLLFPVREGPPTGPADVPADLELQHVGITFRWIGGVPRPRNIGAADPADPSLATVREVVAATAACLLVRRDRFLAIGGFDEAYVYGYEDVDLCLRWREGGERIVVDGRAILWHDESATRRIHDDRETKRRQRHNLQVFNGTWGPRLFRQGMLEALEGRRSLTSEAPGLMVIGGDADPALAALAAELGTRGWTVDRRSAADPPAAGVEPDGAVVVVVADPSVDIRAWPRHAATIGWLGGDARTWVRAPWLDEFDLLVGSDRRIVEEVAAASSKQAHLVVAPWADGLLARVAEWVRARRITILVQARDWVEAPVSGDYHFARALQRQLERLGAPTCVHIRSTWTHPSSTRDDVAIHLWGRAPMGPRRGQHAILWILYHPDLVTDELLGEYDRVLVASDRFAEQVRGRVEVPVHALHQATDPERFRPGVDGPRHQLLFVGNSRGARRRILDDLAGTSHDLAVYGRGWEPELLDHAYWRGDSVPNEVLAGYYANAAIVLNDHWPESAAAGFINNRVYDAIAAGAFVLSDAVEGMDAEFDGGVVTYRDAPDLIRLVDAYLADPAAREARVARGRAAVLARHTFAHRMEELLRLLDAGDGDATGPGPVESAGMSGA